MIVVRFELMLSDALTVALSGSRVAMLTAVPLGKRCRSPRRDEDSFEYSAVMWVRELMNGN